MNIKCNYLVNNYILQDMKKINSFGVFKERVPIDIFIELMESITDRKDAERPSKYLVDTATFKRGVYNGSIHVFFEKLKPYYRESKQMYVDRKLTYNSFITVVRHVCKCIDVEYTNQMRYDKSTYEIVYLVGVPGFSTIDN